MEDGDPVLETKIIKHHGGVNRIRATKIQEDQTLAASWSDTGKVHIWDLSHSIRGLDAPQHDRPPTGPLFTFSGHPTEGFSMDWSPTVNGRLLTGDCKRFIYLWEMQEASWDVRLQPFSGHTASVEDVQWRLVSQKSKKKKKKKKSKKKSKKKIKNKETSIDFQIKKQTKSK